jgi:hypothetical protein
MKLIFLCLIFALMCVPAHALTIRAKIYAVGETSGKPLFVQELKIEAQAGGKTKSVSSIQDDKGETVMTEEAVLNGTETVSQTVEQRQIGEAYELKRVAGKLVFSTYKLEKGQRILSSEKSETPEENFITGPVTIPFLAKHWAELDSGKTVSAKFGVFELERSVAFEFSRSGSSESALDIVMRPASFLVKMLVAPIYFSLDRKTKLLLRYKGRTPVKRKVFGNWKPFDAEILYEVISEK